MKEVAAAGHAIQRQRDRQRQRRQPRCHSQPEPAWKQTTFEQPVLDRTGEAHRTRRRHHRDRLQTTGSQRALERRRREMDPVTRYVEVKPVPREPARLPAAEVGNRYQHETAGCERLTHKSERGDRIVDVLEGMPEHDRVDRTRARARRCSGCRSARRGRVALPRRRPTTTARCRTSPSRGSRARPADLRGRSRHRARGPEAAHAGPTAAPCAARSISGARGLRARQLAAPRSSARHTVRSGRGRTRRAARRHERERDARAAVATAGYLVLAGGSLETIGRPDRRLGKHGRADRTVWRRLPGIAARGIRSPGCHARRRP